jgi:thiol-disulfide isomerase/thioredoxin
MKSAKLNYVLILLSITLINCTNTDITILSKTNSQLQKLSTIQYQTDFKNYNYMTGELGKCDTAIAIFDFNSKDTLIGAKYLFSRKTGDSGFDGENSFYTDKGKKHLIYNSVKTKDDLNGLQFSQFSIQRLRDLIPQMLTDTAIHFNRLSDTIINGTDCYKYELIMHGKGINMLGELTESKNINHHELMIGKKDYLPRRYIQYYNKNSPVWIVSYNKFNLSPIVNDSIFTYSLRDPDFIKYTPEEYLAVTKNERIINGNSYLGKKALDWTLPLINGDSITLSQIDANLIMLEFWFPNCSGCIAAIPEINEIQKIYRSKGLKVYGIEFTKSDNSGLSDYIKKMKIEYPTLSLGKEIASKYYVSAGPTIFLINKKGEFVYARVGFIKDELLKEIGKYI